MTQRSSGTCHGCAMPIIRILQKETLDRSLLPGNIFSVNKHILNSVSEVLLQSLRLSGGDREKLIVYIFITPGASVWEPVHVATPAAVQPAIDAAIRD